MDATTDAADRPVDRHADEASRRLDVEAPPGAVRDEDIEPYTGLHWVGTVSKAAAIFLLVALVSEFAAGLREDGFAAVPYLLGETARTFVFMIILWGAGDLVRLMVDAGHDIRAQRILLTRLDWRTRSIAADEVDREAAGATPSEREEAVRPPG